MRAPKNVIKEALIGWHGRPRYLITTVREAECIGGTTIGVVVRVLAAVSYHSVVVSDDVVVEAAEKHSARRATKQVPKIVGGETLVAGAMLAPCWPFDDHCHGIFRLLYSAFMFGIQKNYIHIDP
jgi:hypothetical protein